MMGAVHKSIKFGPQISYTFILRPETTPFRAFMVGAPGSNIPAGICGLSERQLIGTAKGGKKKKQPGNERKLAGVLSMLSKVCMVPSSQVNSRSP